jgi:hypothetical protein
VGLAPDVRDLFAWTSAGERGLSGVCLVSTPRRQDRKDAAMKKGVDG